MMNNMYVYLARRDRKGVKFLGGFPHANKVYPTKISEADIPKLSSDQKTSNELVSAIRENRMEYEMIIETAPSFDSLRSSLVKRGYSKIPASQFSTSLRSGSINDKVLVTKESVMTRRGSAVKT